MPMVFAASTISVPAGTVTLRPSMVRLLSGTDGDLADAAPVPQGVVFVFVPAVADGGVDDPASRVAQSAQAAAVLQAVVNTLERVALGPGSVISQPPPT